MPNGGCFFDPKKESGTSEYTRFTALAPMKRCFFDRDIWKVAWRGTITAYFADETDGAEEIIDDNEISKFVDKSDVSDIIKRDSNHFEELLDKFEEWLLWV